MGLNAIECPPLTIFSSEAHMLSWKYKLKNWQFVTSVFQVVEREISFRTETGLYYSYYKQLVNAPSLSQGKNLLYFMEYKYFQQIQQVSLCYKVTESIVVRS